MSNFSNKIDQTIDDIQSPAVKSGLKQLTKIIERLLIEKNSLEETLRDKFAMSITDTELKCFFTDDISFANILDISIAEFNSSIVFNRLRAIAKLRYIFADVMLATRRAGKS